MVSRLLRDPTVLVAGALFVALALACCAAPLWASVAGTGPETVHETLRIEIDGEPTDVVSLDGVPIGPTYSAKYFLGADVNGRDTAVRLLYGGRNSLLIGIAAALITALLATVVALVGGYLRGPVDAVLSRAMDLIWAFPVVLLGVALGTAFAEGGLEIGPFAVGPGSKLIPTGIIALVYVPYMARPLRGQVLELRERDFVAAARTVGAGPIRIMLSEILPNLRSLTIVFLPLMVANAILLESALSFVGAGVQNEPTWGTMISEGVEKITDAPHLTIFPGLMLVVTVLALNVVGDRVRDLLDPRMRLAAARR